MATIAAGFLHLSGWARGAEVAPLVTAADVAAGLRMERPDFALSPDARWLSYATNRGDGLMDLANGKKANVTEGWSFLSRGAPGSSWSPDGASVALIVRREAKSALALWTPGAVSPADQRELLVFPRRLSPVLPAIWSPDGKVIYFAATQDLPWPKLRAEDDASRYENNNVALEMSGSYRVPRAPSAYEREYPGAEAMRTRGFILALEVASGRWGVLAKGNDIEGMMLAPDGRHLAVLQVRDSIRGNRLRAYARQPRADIYVIATAAVGELPMVDLETVEDRKAGWSDKNGRLQPALEGVGLLGDGWFIPPYFSGTSGYPALTWAPDSRSFAYATVGRSSTGDVYIYDLAQKQTRNLTEKISAPLSEKAAAFGRQYTHAYDSRKFGYATAPLWLPSGRGLVVIGRGEVWHIPLDAAQAPRALSVDSVDAEAVRIVPATDGYTAAHDAQGRIVVITRTAATGLDAIWKLNPATGHAGKLIETGLALTFPVAIDRANTKFFYTGQSETRARGLYQVALDAEPAAASATAAPQTVLSFRSDLADFRFPRSQLLQWKTPDGLAGYGLLYLPEHAAKDHPVPMIVSATPGDEESVADRRRRIGPQFLTENLEQRLRDGFAVLQADIPLSDQGVYAQPMKQMIQGVDAATDAALATGWVDAGRLGIEGVGEGAFMVNAVIAHTARFKAAVAVNGGINLITRFLGPPGSDPLNMEAGAGRMEVPFWTDPRRYVDNSPLSSWNQVETPLLLVHGARGFPAIYIDEAFNGLRHLGRSAIFARYPRMLDNPNAEARRRIDRWFGEHLMGGEATAQWADEGNAFGGGILPGDALVEPRPRPKKPDQGEPLQPGEMPVYKGRPKKIEN